MNVTKRLLGLIGCIFLGSHHMAHIMHEDNGQFETVFECTRCGRTKQHA